MGLRRSHPSINLYQQIFSFYVVILQSVYKSTLLEQVVGVTTFQVFFPTKEIRNLHDGCLYCSIFLFFCSLSKTSFPEKEFHEEKVFLFIK